VIFLDAIVCKVRHEGNVRNKAAHLAVGSDAHGKKEVLGIWVETTEGAKFSLRVMDELKARGVEDLLIVVCDGLTGLPAAVTACWLRTILQTCIVHLTRASVGSVNYQDRKRVAVSYRSSTARSVSRPPGTRWTPAPTATSAGTTPAIKWQWETSWEQVIPFLAFAPAVRKVIYTTNTIESIDYQLRKISKTRGHLPNDDALVTLLHLGYRDLGRTDIRGRGGRSNCNWKMALNQFDIMLRGRLDQA
jgi:putative transposase